MSLLHFGSHGPSAVCQVFSSHFQDKVLVWSNHVQQFIAETFTGDIADHNLLAYSKLSSHFAKVQRSESPPFYLVFEGLLESRRLVL